MTRNTKYLKTETPGLVKDPASGALLYTDRNRIAAYKRNKERLIQADAASERLDRVEAAVDDIKRMLQALLEK